MEKGIRLRKRSIDTLGGKEIFLSYESKNHLYSLLRLRLPNKKEKVLFNELKNSALIREIHTFGTALELKETDKKKAQHRGLGKKLLGKAEEVAKTGGYREIAVISAIGTRNYYRKLGFKLEGLYMTKEI